MEIRIVWPAIFSIVGTFMLMGFAGLILWLGFLCLCVDFSGILPFLWIGLAGLVGFVFSFALLFDEAHHRRWGMLVLVLCGVASYFLIQSLPSALQTAVGPPSPLAYILVSAPVLGLAGGSVGNLLEALAQKRTQPPPA